VTKIPPWCLRDARGAVLSRMNAALAQHVVARLLAQGEPLVFPADVTGPLAAHGGNLREALLALYVLHEARTRARSLED
jgi:hypothetical protein